MVGKIGTRRTVTHTVGEDEVCDHLRNMNIYKTVRPDEMHPKVLREVAV